MTINKVVISGNIGSSELRKTANGLAILSFSVAVDEYRKDAENYTSWIGCTLFGTRAEKLEFILTKGTKVSVGGRLHQQRWESDGQNHSRIEIIVDELEIMSQKEREQPQAQQAVQDAFPGAQVEEQTAYAQDDLHF